MAASIRPEGAGIPELVVAVKDGGLEHGDQTEEDHRVH